MRRILDELGYRIVKQIGGTQTVSQSSYIGSSHKLATHFGDEFWKAIRGKTIIDLGSGAGNEVLELGTRGAKRVIGVELREHLLERGRKLALERGLSNICEFTQRTEARADLVLSIDSFEHFNDPAAVLETMSGMLAPDGEVWISFGWPWYHPYGGHMFSVFPWAHLVFSERSLIRWRSDFKTDNATRFAEVEGGLNQMSIRKLEQIVRDSSLQILELKLIPIQSLRWMHGRLTREFTTALVQCRLRAKSRLCAKGPSQQ